MKITFLSQKFPNANWVIIFRKKKLAVILSIISGNSNVPRKVPASNIIIGFHTWSIFNSRKFWRIMEKNIKHFHELKKKIPMVTVLHNAHKEKLITKLNVSIEFTFWLLKDSTLFGKHLIEIRNITPSVLHLKWIQCHNVLKFNFSLICFASLLASFK